MDLLYLVKSHPYYCWSCVFVLIALLVFSTNAPPDGAAKKCSCFPKYPARTSKVHMIDSASKLVTQQVTPAAAWEAINKMMIVVMEKTLGEPIGNDDEKVLDAYGARESSGEEVPRSQEQLVASQCRGDDYHGAGGSKWSEHHFRTKVVEPPAGSSGRKVPESVEQAVDEKENPVERQQLALRKAFERPGGASENATERQENLQSEMDRRSTTGNGHPSTTGIKNWSYAHRLALLGRSINHPLAHPPLQIRSSTSTPGFATPRSSSVSSYNSSFPLSSPNPSSPSLPLPLSLSSTGTTTNDNNHLDRETPEAREENTEMKEEEPQESSQGDNETRHPDNDQDRNETVFPLDDGQPSYENLTELEQRIRDLECTLQSMRENESVISEFLLRTAAFPAEDDNDEEEITSKPKRVGDDKQPEKKKKKDENENDCSDMTAVPQPEAGNEKEYKARIQLALEDAALEAFAATERELIKIKYDTVEGTLAAVLYGRKVGVAVAVRTFKNRMLSGGNQQKSDQGSPGTAKSGLSSLRLPGPSAKENNNNSKHNDNKEKLEANTATGTATATATATGPIASAAAPLPAGRGFGISQLMLASSRVSLRASIRAALAWNSQEPLIVRFLNNLAQSQAETAAVGEGTQAVSSGMMTTAWEAEDKEASGGN